MASAKSVSGALSLFDSIWTASARDLTDHRRAERLKAYTLALASLSDDELTAAAMLCSSRCRFFPLPADLLEQARPAISAAVASEAAANEALEGILACYERGEQVISSA